MHYYQHNIKSFNNATRHLTRVERSLYRDAIELYYDNEQPLPADNFDRLARRLLANTPEEKEALQFVLDEFFEKTGNVWTHDKCDEELEKYHEAKSAKARAGKASAEARKAAQDAKKQGRKQQDSTGDEQLLNSVQQTSNHKPLTINQEPDNTMSSDDDLIKRSTEKIPYADIVNLFNQICVSLPDVIKLTDKRRKAIRSIWSDDKKHQQIEFWEWYFKKVEASDFLAGRRTSWMAGFDWILKNANFVKVIEKHYDN